MFWILAVCQSSFCLSQQQDTVKHLPYSLLVAASLLLLPTAAQAARLESWRFDANQNRLEFTTDEDVQPQAQLITDPTRLVIDLPGIILGRPAFTEAGSGAIRSIRIGQFDRGTTRMVVELSPGYTLDPNQVKFRGITARQWTVQLPSPQRLPATLTTSQAESASQSDAPPVVVPATPTLPPTTTGGFSKIPSLNQPSSPPVSPSPPATQLATIESVSLENQDRQLVIRSDRPIRYDSGWDRASSAYRITIAGAQLARPVRGPQLDANSPILKLRLRQEDNRTVAILVQPAAGVQIGDLNQPNQRLLALSLQRTRAAVMPPRNSVASIPVPQPPQNGNPLPPRNNPVMGTPRVPNGKIVVVIDPGHGGPDPGAIGIGGLQEKGIVLDIGTKVANMLEQQGIQAVLTRQDDIDLDLAPRVKLAEQLNATVFVSIHANSIDLSRPDISGLETYYYDSGLELAQTIHSRILQDIGIQDRRVRSARFYVLRKTTMPAVLVEVGFVTGQDDASKLSNPAYRSQMAAAIARGIVEYIQRR